MKINPSVGGLDESKATGNAPARPGSNGAAGTGAVAGTDTIHLSALSAQLSALGTSLATGSEFDRAKVDAIKEAIRDGRLTVNANVVAERMLDAALAMMRKGS
jgi:negative regulator of flagellin synthesis FlgM